MPGNQTSPDRNGEVELKVSYMVKRSQGKSALGAVNFKKRVFVLTPTRLTYFDGTLEKRGSQKGYIDLTKVKVVEKVLEGAFDKPSFQVTHGDLTLYVIASNEAEQQEWITLLRQYCRENVLLQGMYHPGIFVNGKWSCCDHRSKHSQGCTVSFCGGHQDGSSANHVSPTHTGAGPMSRGPLPPTPSDDSAPTPPPHSGRYHQTHGPNPNAIQSYEHNEIKKKRGGGGAGGNIDTRAAEPLPPPVPVRGRNTAPQPNDFDVVAMYDYPGLERGDLALIKGQKVTVFDDTREYWWRARDDKGNEGYIPSNYVKKAGLDSEDWFFPSLSRTRAENVLKSEGREGGFVVRNSSRENMYTLSICHDGQVRHYHIKQDEMLKYYISDKHRFSSIKELIEYHKLNGGGLVTRLRRPPNQLAPNLATLSPLFACDPLLRQHKSGLLHITSLHSSPSHLLVGTSAGVTLALQLPFIEPSLEPHPLLSPLGPTPLYNGHKEGVDFLLVLQRPEVPLVITGGRGHEVFTCTGSPPSPGGMLSPGDTSSTMLLWAIKD